MDKKVEVDKYRPTKRRWLMATKATLTEELVVTGKDETGTLARATLPLKQNNINIECLCCYGIDGKATFHFVTSNNKKAKEVLTKNGWTVGENPAVWLQTDNTPGTLNKATSQLSEARINVEYCYSSSPSGSKTTSVVFHTANDKQACEILNRG